MKKIKSLFGFKRFIPLVLIFSMLIQLVVGIAPASAYNIGIWPPKNTVSFDSNGGTFVPSAQVNTWSLVQKPADPVRVGYKFDGWHYDACTSLGHLDYVCNYFHNNFGAHTVYDWDFAHYPVLVDLTLEAQWIALAKYTVSTVASPIAGGTILGANSYYKGDTLDLIATSNDGYSFANWSGDCSGTNANYHVSNLTGNMSCTANFAINQYTITFNTDGGSTITPITQNYGSDITAPLNPNWEDGSRKFIGWDKLIPAAMPAYSQTITANWEDKYVLAFNDNGADDGQAPIIPDYYDQNEVVLVPDNHPTDPYVKAGYHFAGWTTEKNAGTFYAPGDDITIDAPTVILYVKWEKNQYTIDFNEAGGSTVDDITADFETPIVTPADPTRNGYTFVGWSSAIPATMPAFNQTISAQWTANSYSIYFDEAGGSTVSDITQAYGTVVTAPADPTRIGYAFAGWVPVVPTTMPAYNSTLTAQWANLLVTVTYVAGNGGTVKGASAQIINYGEDTSEVTAAPSAGYTFDSWSDGITTATRSDLAVTLSKTVTANFKASGEVKGITTNNESEVAGATDKTDCGGWCSCNLFLGISWCWWILIIAVILAVIIWRVVVFIERRREEK
jgi:uncharacterized repeat protein (TIGR02543 family)